VADARQFGSPKVLQFGDKTSGNRAGDSVQCAQCEAMLADALDGALTAAEQERFDAHVAECGPCSQMLADARRGGAWLEMLRTPRPEPPVELLERILAETSGAQIGWAQTSAGADRVVSGGMRHVGSAGATPGRSPVFGGVAAVAPGYAAPGAAANYGNVVPFRRRMAVAFRGNSFGQIMLQPRLAMTAAMAFFSIALTMNLTGVRLQDLRASDLRPSSLKRDYHDANARVVRYYKGLRVVYELESRVHDFEGASDNDVPASQSVPSKGLSNPGQPGGQTPLVQPGSGGQKDAPPADRGQPDRKRPAANPGTSRREDLNPSHRLVAATHAGESTDTSFGKSFGDSIHTHLERSLV
jgi:hypothetical protein